MSTGVAPLFSTVSISGSELQSSSVISTFTPWAAAPGANAQLQMTKAKAPNMTSAVRIELVKARGRVRLFTDTPRK